MSGISLMSTADRGVLLSFYEKLCLIRYFEERALSLFSEGKLNGTTHACIGQEANAVGVLSACEKGDAVISNHRCHGHYLAWTNDVEGLMAELMGRETGVVSGRGGSQHLCGGNFYSNGVQGGGVPIAVGIAFALKSLSKQAVLFIGDGTLGQGNVYESLNLARLLEVPLLIVVENNQYAQSTPIYNNLRGSIAARFAAFDIQSTELSTFDVMEIFGVAESIIAQIRETSLPQALILNTYRFCSHSKSDDFRPVEEIESWKKLDPLSILEKKIGGYSAPEIEEIRRISKVRVEQAVAMAELAGYSFISPDDLDLDKGMEI